MPAFTLMFAGTGAADFSPLLQTEYRDKLDKNVRRCASLLVNRTLLIDCGPHTLHALTLAGTDPAAVSDVLLTHLHADHYDPASLNRLAALHPGLRIWCHPEAAPDCPAATVIHTAPFSGVSCGDVTVTALPANHTACALHYLLQREGKRLFYGCDGAWMLSDSYSFLKKTALDLMILDATVGDYEGDYRMAEHNSIPMIRLMCKSFATVGITRPDTQIYLSHMARTLYDDDHAARAERLGREGLFPAYDGLTLTL